MAFTITTTVQKIISEMDDNSQYTDFVNDFEVIQHCVENTPRNNVVHDRWVALYAAMYAAKGDLNSVKDELQELGFSA